ncbi:MAG: hypothetical protein ACXWIU_11585, partial [Limisphaerales bacterium]
MDLMEALKEQPLPPYATNDRVLSEFWRIVIFHLEKFSKKSEILPVKQLCGAGFVRPANSFRWNA